LASRPALIASSRTAMNDPPYTLEINLTKSKWIPKHLEEIPQVLSRAFETHVTLKEIKPLYGTDHVMTWPLKEDGDIKVFVDAKSKMREAFVEKVIRFTHPRGLMPRNWQPKKVKILATGARIAKYFGEDQVGSRQVEVSLKLFECGHFYMKQTLPGSGATPYQIIMEGRWTQTERGFQLEYMIRYTGQTTKKSMPDLAIQALPPNEESFLARCGESENYNQLNGLIPAIVGEDPMCRVEIYREPDVVEKGKARFNEEDDDVQPSSKADQEDDSKTPEQDEPKREKLRPTPVPRTWTPPEPRSFLVEGSSVSASAASAPSSSPGFKESSKESASKVEEEARASEPRPAASSSTSVAEKDDEAMWPTWLGLAIFLLLILFFARQNLMAVSNEQELPGGHSFPEDL